MVFSWAFHGAGMALWYHFAIMFEALFILTTLDAGTRVGRYLLQDLLGNAGGRLGQTKTWRPPGWPAFSWSPPGVGFLFKGVRDPLGGINSLWPIFGIANQLLASIALCLGTTVILKMQLAVGGKKGRPILAWITLGPLLWLLAVTATASVEKIFHPDPKIGFLSAARALALQLPPLRSTLDAAPAQSPAWAAAAKAWQTTATLCSMPAWTPPSRERSWP